MFWKEQKGTGKEDEEETEIQTICEIMQKMLTSKKNESILVADGKTVDRE